MNVHTCEGISGPFRVPTVAIHVPHKLVDKRRKPVLDHGLADGAHQPHLIANVVD